MLFKNDSTTLLDEPLVMMMMMMMMVLCAVLFVACGDGSLDFDNSSGCPFGESAIEAYIIYRRDGRWG
jgi:hypothetical protein